MIERLFVHLLIQLHRKHPSLRFLRRFSFFITPSLSIKHLYKNTTAILRQQRGVRSSGAFLFAQLYQFNSPVRICETPSSRLIQIRNRGHKAKRSGNSFFGSFLCFKGFRIETTRALLQTDIGYSAVAQAGREEAT